MVSVGAGFLYLALLDEGLLLWGNGRIAGRFSLEGLELELMPSGNRGVVRSGRERCRG